MFNITQMKFQQPQMQQKRANNVNFKGSYADLRNSVNKISGDSHLKDEILIGIKRGERGDVERGFFDSILMPLYDAIDHGKKALVTPFIPFIKEVQDSPFAKDPYYGKTIKENIKDFLDSVN